MTHTTGLSAGAVALVVALSAVLAVSCDEPKGTLHVQITRQPVGGSGVDTVFCTFTGTAQRDPVEISMEPITATTYWESSHGVYNSRSYTWSQDLQVITATSFKAAPAGMYLDKPFWFVIRWEDAGGEQVVRSDTAYCE